MKTVKIFLIACYLTTHISNSAWSQASFCQNISFEQGDFTNWTGWTWQHSELYEVKTDPVEGFVDRRHTIISDPEAYDPNTGYQLKMIPPGYTYSARLGDIITAEDRSADRFRCWNQTLNYTMDVDEENSLLIINYALVLEYDPDHLESQEPRFHFTLFDKNGDTIPDCANYQVYASVNNFEGFEFYDLQDGDETVCWRDWTAVGVDLTQYIGQTVTIEFLAADCNQGFDFGYAYFVVECHPLNIVVRNCGDDSIAWLKAPLGFKDYKWMNSDSVVVDTNQVFELANPTEGDTYTCELTSESGCDVKLNTTVHKYDPKANFGSYMIDCINNIVQIVDSSSTNNGELRYIWNFGGDEPVSTQTGSFEHTFLTSGLHDVKLIVINPPSVCSDTLEKVVESFSPPLVDIEGLSTYCPDETVTLEAYGAYRYEWSDGSTGDSIEVGIPDTVILIGYSSTGCVDTNYKVITEEPDWELLSGGDTAFCIGDSTYLYVSGDAVEYVWSTGSADTTVLIKETGEYWVTGSNQRGCIKTSYFNVIEVPLPDVGFSLSENKINIRNNEVIGAVIPQSDVIYEWNLGDGSVTGGPTFNHAYTIDNEQLYYQVSLNATDKYGCINDSTGYVDVIPFVPNVFSPNGDNINDLFMPGLDIQIFDRNGILMYSGREGWDGRYNGQPAGPDTYFYFITYTNRELEEKIEKGYLTLVR